MKKNMRCPACGRRRKKQHEQLASDGKGYSKECRVYQKGGHHGTEETGSKEAR